MVQPELCPRFEQAVGMLSKRWNALIIFSLLGESQRFCTMTESIGISNRLLSERLKELEKDGIVTRNVYPETPVRIEYSLTEKGRALAPVMEEIQKWSQEWLPVQEAGEENKSLPSVKF